MISRNFGYFFSEFSQQFSREQSIDGCREVFPVTTIVHSFSTNHVYPKMPNFNASFQNRPSGLQKNLCHQL